MSITSFGSYLKELRVKKGFTLRDFAEKIGVKPSELSDIEQEKIDSPSKEVLDKLERIRHAR
ncbi:hypothetical protein AGMMS49531_08060 [Endomicrobiia bacterium]|nr:hypothetical protein AGMMS49531_08060 [Endomicrobiia bacterium]GHT66422.1 hypothetical protein AGMMS49556_07330 [Endomicrobiia bacterium]